MAEKAVRPLSPLVWLPTFATDEEDVDRQHRKLMVDINELTNLLFDGHPWSLVVAKSRELREESIEHFRTEEEVLKKTVYARFNQHQADHRHLVGQLDDIVEHLAGQRRASRADIEAVRYLRSMLIDHFFRKDIAYKSHVLISRRKW
jgi:hemerythrin-like metal-binding protein